MLTLNDTPEDEASRAFNDAEGQSFANLKLSEFSFRRQRAATALGMRYGRLSPADFRAHPNPLHARAKTLRKQLAKKPDPEKQAELDAIGEQPAEVRVYDGLDEDAAIVMFVCSLPDSEVANVRRRTTTYEDKFEEWAEANGLALEGPNVNLARHRFCEIVNGLSVSRSEPVMPADHKREDESPNA